MIYEFDEPAACQLKQGLKAGVEVPALALSFGQYVAEVIFTLPYWRSSDEAAGQAEEVLEQIDAGVRTYVVRASTLEALRTQMKLADSGLLQVNPQLVRPSLRFLRVVNGARKHVEPEARLRQGVERSEE